MSAVRPLWTLHVHHTRYLKGSDPWDYPDSLLLTLCEECHGYIHSGESVTGSEAFLESVLKRGGSAGVFWALCCFLDEAIPSGVQVPDKDWTDAALAFRASLMESMKTLK